MSKTRIEWVKNPDGSQGETINPVKGLCPMHCKTPDGYEYCYAAGERGLYKRFKWNPEIRFDNKAWRKILYDIESYKNPSRIFVGSTIELFGEWVEMSTQNLLFKELPSWFPQHTFIFLTKQPQNLIKWSPFPDNCWVGVSATSAIDAIIRIPKLRYIDATVKFISFEPLLKPIASLNQLYVMLKLSGISWLIIGQRTPASKKTEPKISWIKEIVEAADKAHVPVFLKDNLWDVLYSQAWDDDIFWANDRATLRQEFPK